MNEVPAFPAIIAKLLVMVDKTLGVFATVTETTPYGACGITSYNVTVTDCGTALIDTLANLIYHGITMAGHFVKALESFSV
jgi:hypothetical protein